MPEIAARLAILLLASLLTWLLVWCGRLIVARQRQRALSAAPLPALASANTEASPTRVQVLAFSSADCRQCHQLQAPALKRVQEARGDAILITEIDAQTESELAQHYHILTVPATVLLDGQGKARAVNYGFASTRRLLEQIDEILQASSAR
jgi:thioredoxin-like negative regulator of GroEL